jgi:hypothetical protein
VQVSERVDGREDKLPNSPKGTQRRGGCFTDDRFDEKEQHHRIKVCGTDDTREAVEDKVVLSFPVEEVVPYLYIPRLDPSTDNGVRSTRSQLFFSEYDISGADEYIEEETDKDRTETIVSRTSIGEKSSFIKEFGVTSYQYDHVISIPLRTIMCIDLPRVDYDKGKKTKKKDLDFVREQNRMLGEKRKADKLKKEMEKGD